MNSIIASPKFLVGYKSISQDRLLGIVNQSGYNFVSKEYTPKKYGLNRVCPCCGETNFIPFYNPIHRKSGDRIQGTVYHVTCSKCNVSYTIQDGKSVEHAENKSARIKKVTLIRRDGMEYRHTR